MKYKIRIFLLLLSGCLPLAISAQMPPTWLHSQVRELEYPSTVYFSEFTEGNRRSGENASELLDRLKSDAKRGAAGNIRTLIKSVVEKTDRQETFGHNFKFTSVYQDYTQQTVQADIAGIHTESYYDERRQWGYAFSYVKKSELATYYRAQIGYQLQQVENALALAASLVGNGEKSRARTFCEDALQPLSKAEFAQNLLTAVSPYETESLQLERLSLLKNRLSQTLIDLEQGIYIFVECDETNLGQPCNAFSPKLKYYLTDNQCSITDNPAQADYKISIKASSRKHPGSETLGNDKPVVYSLADVQVEIYSNYKKMVVYSDGVSNQKGGGVTYESAGLKALEKAAKQVGDNIKSWIVRE